MAPTAPPVPEATKTDSGIQTTLTKSEGKAITREQSVVKQRKESDYPDELLTELRQSMTRAEGNRIQGEITPAKPGWGSGGITPTNDNVFLPSPTNATSTLSEYSNSEAVQVFLQDRGFSIRTLSAVDNQTGAMLFALSKSQLQQFIGREEGAKLYSQLLVQKSFSGYGTNRSKELMAVLESQRQKLAHQQQQQQQQQVQQVNGYNVVGNYAGAPPQTIPPVPQVRQLDQDKHQQQQQQQQQQRQQPDVPQFQQPDQQHLQPIQHHQQRLNSVSGEQEQLIITTVFRDIVGDDASPGIGSHRNSDQNIQSSAF